MGFLMSDAEGAQGAVAYVLALIRVVDCFFLESTPRLYSMDNQCQYREVRMPLSISSKSHFMPPLVFLGGKFA